MGANEKSGRPQQEDSTFSSRNFTESDLTLHLQELMHVIDLYPVHVTTRKSLGLMMRKLSVTESQRSAQFRGTVSRRKPSVASANWATFGGRRARRLRSLSKAIARAIERQAFRHSVPRNILACEPPVGSSAPNFTTQRKRPSEEGLTTINFKKPATALNIRQRHCRFFEKTRCRPERVTPI